MSKSFFKSTKWRSLAGKGRVRGEFWTPLLMRVKYVFGESKVYPQTQEKVRRLRQIERGQLQEQNGLVGYDYFDD